MTKQPARMRELLDLIPPRTPLTAGLRWWFIDRRGSLVSPYTGTRTSNTAIVTAECPHGNAPPSPHCPCGIHYLTKIRPFFTVLEHERRKHPRHPVAVTLGVGVGRTLLDALPDEKWIGVLPMRSERFITLHCMIPKNVPPERATLLRMASQVPVTRGIGEAQAFRVLNTLRTALQPDTKPQN